MHLLEDLREAYPGSLGGNHPYGDYRECAGLRRGHVAQHFISAFLARWGAAGGTDGGRSDYGNVGEMRLKSILGAALILLVAAHEDVDAQEGARSVSSGLRLNVHAGSILLDSDNGREHSVHPGLSAAYGNSRLFSVFMTWDRAPLNDGANEFTLRHIDVGFRVQLRGADAALVPFLIGAYTWRSADYGEIQYMGDLGEVKAHGAGFTAGVGGAYYVSQRLAVEASLKRSGARLDRVDVNGLTIRNVEGVIREATTWRLNLGLSFWIPQ